MRYLDRGRASGRRRQPRPRRRPDRGRAAVDPPRRRPGVVHRRAADRQAPDGGGLADGQEGRPRAGRQEPQHRVRRRRSRRRARLRAHRGLPALGPGVLGRRPPDRARVDQGRLRRRARRAAPSRSGSAARWTTRPRPARSSRRPTATRSRRTSRRASPKARRCAAAASGPTTRPWQDGFFYLPTVLDDCTSQMSVRPGRVVRPGAHGRDVHRRGRRGRDRQRQHLRARRCGLDRRTPAAPSGSPRGCGWARSGSTTTTRTCRRPSGAATSSPASAASSARSGLEEYRETKHIWHNVQPEVGNWFGGE